MKTDTVNSATKYRLQIKILLFIIALSLSFCTLLLIVAQIPPFSVYRHILQGAFGSWNKLIQVLNVWAPLTICATGLVYTFRVNLWNIGIEGQVIMGAVFATALLRINFLVSFPLLSLFMAMLAAICGGCFWSCITGYLKIKGGVNEIFVGLGMNFLSQGFLLWLIFGPWKRAGMASMSGTEVLSTSFWLPTFFEFKLAPIGIFLALVVIAVSLCLLQFTYFGLALKAVGGNPAAALVLGLQPNRYFLSAMLLCGALAGLVGYLQVTATYHRLIPAISSNYGYLAILVAMLANYRILPIPIIALFFASLNVGSIQLPMALQIDSSFGGIIQGALVLSALGLYAWHSQTLQRTRRRK